jgi:hypothetical protein
MSAYRCESCGHDGPLSEPCPICEAAVRSALDGGFDVTKPQICVPMAETKAILARLEALRLEHAVLIEQLAEKNRQIQRLGEMIKCPRKCSECDGHHHRVEGSDRCRHCNAILPDEELDL